MIRNKAKLFAILLLPAIAFLSIPNGAAAAECPAFPKLSFWGDLSHDSVQQYVEQKFAGDWGAYLERLEYIKKGLRGIHDRGKGALIKMKGRKVVLKGEKLGNYILLSETRIGIVRCLADQMEASGLQDFATAAGGNGPVEVVKYTEPARNQDAYRMYVTLPLDLVVKLRQRAVRRSLIENQKVSVNDIITRALESEFGRTGE